jgi:hypothetical protein
VLGVVPNKKWCQFGVEQPCHTNAPTIATCEHCHDRALQSRSGRVEHKVVKVQYRHISRRKTVRMRLTHFRAA